MLGLAMTVSLALAGCTGGTGDAPSPSPSTVAPTPSVTATATATASPEPEPSESSTAEPTPEPEPSATVDPGGDGVVRDEPYTVPSPTAEGQKGAVAPAITRWGVEGDTYVVAAVVDGVVEDGGTCTVTLTRGFSKVSASGPATRSATSMNCAEGLGIPLADLGTGTWSATVAYSSERYAGVTAAKDVEVP